MQSKASKSFVHPEANPPQGNEKPRYHHGDLRVALMSSALSLIEQFGVRGFSLKDAARQAGVSTAAPYRHFADKAALVDALCAEGFRLFNGALAEGYRRGETSTSRIVELGVAYVQFALDHPAYIQIMFGLGDKRESAAHPSASAPGEDVSGFQLLVCAVEGLLPKASPEVRNDVVVACWSIVHGFALLQMEGALAATIRPHDPELQLRRTLSVLIGQMTDLPGRHDGLKGHARTTPDEPIAPPSAYS